MIPFTKILYNNMNIVYNKDLDFYCLQNFTEYKIFSIRGYILLSLSIFGCLLKVFYAYIFISYNFDPRIKSN